MKRITRQSPLSSVYTNADAMAIALERAPEVFTMPSLLEIGDVPIGGFVSWVLRDSDRVDDLMRALAQFDDPNPGQVHEEPIRPKSDIEPESIPRSSAAWSSTAQPTTDRRVVVTLDGPSCENPFVDVELSAVVHAGEHSIHVGGFYAGRDTWEFRFLPPFAGDWSFTTRSSARSLDGVSGVISVAQGTGRGPTRVASPFGFEYANGESYVPLGTTAYAWLHQPDAVRDRTLATLAASPFNKLRMCIFPKHYSHNSTEPERFVFERSASGGWDTTRFDLDFFADLEAAVDQLAELGIVADLILFHPYDRWGFSSLSDAADERYVTYVAHRLSSFANVWWSMANEYDLVISKTPEIWNRLARRVVSCDPVGHPISIHNAFDLYDYSVDWATHASIQNGELEIGNRVEQWRRSWRKPVVLDEFGYEGTLEDGWGNLTASEVVRRFWEVTVRGGYATHGETYYSPDADIWWAKGGTLRGEAAPRLAFLRSIIAESPSGRIEPLPTGIDANRGGAEGTYVLAYCGATQPAFRHFDVPEGAQAAIDVIDTWEMTITTLPGSFTGHVRVDLPGKQFMAVRLRLSPAE